MVQNMVKKNSVISLMAVVYNMRHGFMIRNEECWPGTFILYFPEWDFILTPVEEKEKFSVILKP